ncbi:MAG: SUMF1/EgtB/PvdO family nonheme iron enzyme [Planctomycetaceae bacterium]|nr:SUMF1/EgtB/PvdO family nonheme iron enzyme [Planctomycetaceae bacterium]
MSKNIWLIVFAVMFSMFRGAMAQDHYAVLIGVETYDTSTFNNLQFAGDDAVALSMQLERLGFKTTTMTSESVSARLRPTTPKKITDVIEAMGRSCAKDDTLVIALSGHGVQFSDEELLPTGVRETYFCPSDANLGDKSTLLKISSIVDAMNQTKASRKLLLVDACQENVLSSKGQKKGGRVIDLGSVHETRRTVPGGIAILFSCSDKQFSWEHPPLGNSVFTYHVIEYLRGSAQARYYDEGKIELNGLVAYVGKSTNDYVIQKRMTSDGQFPVLRGNTTNWTLGNPPTNPMRMTNSLQMEFALIPAGTFQMGTRLTPEQIHQQYPDPSDMVEHYQYQTQHEVKLTKPFYIGVHEVAVGQFRKFVEAEGYKTDAERDGKGGYGFDTEKNEFSIDSKYTWRNPGLEQDDTHPVVNVSWNDAVAFCRWLSRVDGLEYRLPTEAEWEYSCRAGSSREFTFGDDAEQLAGFGNLADAALKSKVPNAPTIRGNDGSIFTSRVGSYRSNEFGLYDMHGNVWEWCSDWYGVYPTSSVEDPVGPATGLGRVRRGGSWGYVASCRSASRHAFTPAGRDFHIGFRVALSSTGIPQSPEADK